MKSDAAPPTTSPRRKTWLSGFAQLGLVALLASLPATALADPKDDARRHFAAGLQAAQQGEYNIALQRFLAAQEAYPHPATLYNIARTYADMEDFENSLAYYRLFREMQPEKAAEVDPIIQVMEARLAENTRPTNVGVVSGGGGGGEGGGGQVVYVGPSDAELARLADLAAEVAAIREALQSRLQAEQAQAAAAGQVISPGGGVQPEIIMPTGPGITVPGDPGTATEGETPDAGLALPDAGFLTGAYEKIVVTASRYGQDPLDSPSTLTVITEDDIRMTGATSLVELFRRSVGVDIFEATVGKPEVNIRGFPDELANKVLILIDGRSTYVDFLGTTFIENLPITMDEIERIEIIRGPGSAVYGANAVTGVINIITRTPGEGKNIVRAEAGPQADITEFGGYQRGSALATGRVGTTGYRFSAGYKRLGRWAKGFEDGELSALDPFSDDQDIGLRTIRFNGRIDNTFANGDGLVSMSGGYTESYGELLNQGVLNYYGAEFQDHYLRGDFSWKSFHIRAFWNSTSSSQLGPWAPYSGAAFPLNSPADGDIVDIEAESYTDFETGSIKHRVNGGLAYRFKQAGNFIYFGLDENGNPPTYRENHFGVFVQDEMTLDRAKLLLSARYDLDPNVNPAKTFSPRASFIYRVADRTSVRANVGSAFRAPNMIENYLYYALPSGVDGIAVLYGDGKNPNVQLDPERIYTAEVGVHDESTLYHTFDGTVYFNQLGSRIDLTEPSFRLQGYDEQWMGYVAATGDYINRPDKYFGYGAEADLQLYPTDGLDVFTNVTWQQIITRNQSEGGELSKGEDRPWSEIKINTGVMYRSDFKTDFSTDVSYVSPQQWLISIAQPDGSFLLTPFPLQYRMQWNARVGTRPFKDESLELAIVGWNMLGFARPVAEHGEGQPVGGRLFGSVTYSF